MLIDSDKLKQAILSMMPERSEVILIVDNQPEGIVRCKDCEWRGNKKKCILAFVADKQEFPLFFYDQRGEWFCYDGKPKGGVGE